MVCGSFSSNRLLLSILRQSLANRRYVSRLPPPGGKPPLIPPARSKRYTIIHIPWQDAADAKELLWRRHTYNDAVATYRAMYKRLNEEKMKGVTGEEAIQRREDEEFEAVLRANDEENRQIAERRKTLQSEQIRGVEEDTLNEIDAVIRLEEEKLLEYESDVTAMVERSKEFVTLENMEEKILEALENPKEYNHAVDLHGNVYEGDVYLKYLSEAPLAAMPVSEVTTPLKKVGRYDEKGSGTIVPIQDSAQSSSASVK